MSTMRTVAGQPGLTSYGRSIPSEFDNLAKITSMRIHLTHDALAQPGCNVQCRLSKLYLE